MLGSLPRSPLAVLLSGVFVAFPGSARAQTARVRRTVLLHADTAAPSGVIEKLSAGTRVALLSTDHPNGYYDVRAPDHEQGWVYGRYIELGSAAPSASDPIQPAAGVPGRAKTQGC